MTPAELLSAALRAVPRREKWICTLFSYEDSLIKNAVWELKYRGNRRIAALLGAILHHRIEGTLAERAIWTAAAVPLLLPIPLSKKRRRERGFNQCDLLSAELQKLDTGRLVEIRTDLLIKIKETPPQTKTESRKDRLRNLSGAFSVRRPEIIAGRDVIFIDDVVTTGATLAEARKTVRATGAKKVLAFAIAQ